MAIDLWSFLIGIAFAAAVAFAILRLKPWAGWTVLLAILVVLFGAMIIDLRHPA